jgi:hypothetical protein
VAAPSNSGSALTFTQGSSSTSAPVGSVNNDPEIALHLTLLGLWNGLRGSAMSINKFSLVMMSGFCKIDSN